MKPAAIRLDLRHRGTPSTEGYELVAQWRSAQADVHLVDVLDARGGYRWSVLDRDGALRASRGFSTLFEEWQSTVVGAGESAHGVCAESHAVPWLPGGRLRIERRERGAQYRVLFEHMLPPLAALAPIPLRSGVRIKALAGEGPVHVVLVSEAYAPDDEARFFADAQRACEVLLAARPYADCRPLLRLSALFVPSAASGVSTGGQGTAFDSRYGTLGMARYLVAHDLHALGQAIDALAPAVTVVLCQAATYGGSGIFNTHCVVPTGLDDEAFAYVLLHELGHALGGLGDEYFGKQITYDTEGEDDAWEPNVSALDAQGRVKWSHRIDATVPVPTPWDHAQYLRLTQDDGEDEAGRAAKRGELAEVLARQTWRDRIGAFEGAHYRARGMYRPEVDCRMFSRTARHYCTLCNETITAAIEAAART